MESKLLTILYLQLLLTILINITHVNLTINTPSQLNNQYYNQQNEQLRKAQLQRHSKLYLHQDPIKSQRIQLIQPQADQLVQSQFNQDDQQSTTESVECGTSSG